MPEVSGDFSSQKISWLSAVVGRNRTTPPLNVCVTKQSNIKEVSTYQCIRQTSQPKSQRSFLLQAMDVIVSRQPR